MYVGSTHACVSCGVVECANVSILFFLFSECETVEIKFVWKNEKEKQKE